MLETFFFLVILVFFYVFPLASLQTSLSKPHIGTWENRVCRILALFSFKLEMNEDQIVHIWYIQAKEAPQRHTSFDKRWSISCVNTDVHTAPLQPHPPLPCTYFPSPVVNCIPLDDITGNKRQQQDNKRSEPQSTSFISDFITPPLMDVDLYTLLHLTCSIPQPPPPPLSLTCSLTYYLWVSLFFPSVIYVPVTNTSPWISISITVKESGLTLMQRCLGELNVSVYRLRFMTSWSWAGQEAEWIKFNLLVKLFYGMGVRVKFR